MEGVVWHLERGRMGQTMSVTWSRCKGMESPLQGREQKLDRPPEDALSSSMPNAGAASSLGRAF